MRILALSQRMTVKHANEDGRLAGRTKEQGAKDRARWEIESFNVGTYMVHAGKAFEVWPEYGRGESQADSHTGDAC